MKEICALLVALRTLTPLAAGQDSSHQISRAVNDAQPTITAHDPEQASHAGHPGFKLEFENESVRVVRITIGPHEKIPMHELTPRVLVLLTDQNLKVTLPNGESREEHHKAGESMWVTGGRHSGENLSDRPIEFVAVIPQGK